MSSINIETRLGHPIENCQNDFLSNADLRFYEDIINRHPLAKKRSEVEIHYNCHGFVFGSRRTGISDSTEIRKILADDGFIKVDSNNVKEGDIVLYIAENGDIEHSGFVIEEPNKSNYHIPKIYSKWGFGYEFIHWVNDSYYDSSILEYYRIDTNDSRRP